MFTSYRETVLVTLLTYLTLITLLQVQGQIEFDHDDSEDIENRRAIRLADEDNPANGPFALKDAPHPDGGLIELKWLNPNWFILQKSMSWSEAIIACEEWNARLIVLPTIEKAKQLSDTIAANVSEKYEQIIEYERKYRSMEFGPDRRYWIGLTDQVQEGKWMWIRYGLELMYDFWYPGQPDHHINNEGNKEHCASLWNPGYYQDEEIHTHRFNDEPYSNKYYPVCGADNVVKEFQVAYSTKSSTPLTVKPISLNLTQTNK